MCFKILVVDDQKGIQQMLSILFEAEGYKTATASNGLEAVKTVKKDKPDLIIMDVKMPLMDGIEALKEIRKIIPDIPVIMMTAYAEFGKKTEARELGIIDWIYKPLDIFYLKKVVKDVLVGNHKKTLSSF